ncbi:protein phosphatase 2C domain-containing protein [Streptomyces sp. NPDC014776]|uniref:protein phosphatase 2C domain-containing protein n=1 Tax=Streptomyces sp. NPDC014776 TaxID=3364909 RepID=UPI0036F63787
MGPTPGGGAPADPGTGRAAGRIWRPRAPWEPPPATPSEPETFPPGSTAAGFEDRQAQLPGQSGSYGRDDGPRAATRSVEGTAAAPPGTGPEGIAPASLPTRLEGTAPASLPPGPEAKGPEGTAPAPPRAGEPQPSYPAPPAYAPPGGAGPEPASAAAPAAPPQPPAPVAVPPRAYVGSGPPTYDAEPTALPGADPDALDDLVPDTVLDGARYGACTVRAVSVRGDSARYRGEPRRDALLTARFGSGEHALVLVAMATGARATPGAHRAAAEVCRWIGRAVGRSHARLVEDLRAARRGDLKSGLHRLTDRSLGKLRATAAEQGLAPQEYSATLRCLLLPADPACRTRVFFGAGDGGLFRLRGGEWQDLEPRVTEVPKGEAVVGFGSPPAETPEGDRLTMDLGIPTPPSPYEPAPEPPREPFRFRASLGRPGDVLLMCTEGLAEPLRGEPELAAHLADRWSAPGPPGLAAFLADAQVRVKGYADDRTAAAVWEA